MEVGSCVVVPFLDFHVLSLRGLVLPMVGSCVTTLGQVSFWAWYSIGKRDSTIDDEGILVTSIFFPLPLSSGAGSCVATF